MRDIKFRAWENLEKRMETNVQNGVYDDPDEYIDFGRILGYARFDVMQYTGLKDKNGVEIYEGDILEWRYKNMLTGGEVTVRYTVHYYEPSACFKTKEHGSVNDTLLMLTLSKDVYVVGNIYENPEIVTEVN